MVIPPALAPVHVVIVPIGKTKEDINTVIGEMYATIDTIKQSKLTIQTHYLGVQEISLQVQIDEDESKTMGRKYNQHELQGVPVRIGV